MAVNTGATHVETIDGSGTIFAYDVDASIGVRPVINIKRDAIIGGNGTANNPFRIE